MGQRTLTRQLLRRNLAEQGRGGRPRLPLQQVHGVGQSPARARRPASTSLGRSATAEPTWHRPVLSRVLCPRPRPPPRRPGRPRLRGRSPSRRGGGAVTTRPKHIAPGHRKPMHYRPGGALLVHCVGLFNAVCVVRCVFCVVRCVFCVVRCVVRCVVGVVLFRRRPLRCPQRRPLQCPLQASSAASTAVSAASSSSSVVRCVFCVVRCVFCVVRCVVLFKRRPLCLQASSSASSSSVVRCVFCVVRCVVRCVLFSLRFPRRCFAVPLPRAPVLSIGRC